MTGWGLRALLISFCSLAVAAPLSARADPVADFYRGKTVTAVVPFGAGGGYALYTQLLSQHMPRFIPGTPNIVPQYMPGAGGIKATNYVYNVAPKDGSLISMVPDTVVLASVLQPKTIKFKVNEFIWLGTLERVNNVLAVRADSGIRTFADLGRTEAVLGSTGRGSPTFLLPSLARWLSPAKMKIVQGYKGGREMFQAMETRELMGTTISWGVWKALKGDWFRNGSAVPIMQFGMRREADLPEVPLAIDLATTPEQKTVARFMASNTEIGRSFVAPPGMAAEKVTALRDAFDRMVRDPAFIAAAKGKILLNPASGAEVQKVVADASALDARVADIVRTAIFGGK
jgi:tripartite-type tricarboxylate transporter receptor subunit TctC